MADRDLSPLTDDEKRALMALLKRTIDADRYPLSPRIAQLRGASSRSWSRPDRRPHLHRRCGITRRHGPGQSSAGRRLPRSSPRAAPDDLIVA
jgi:hypothetical protein